MDNFLKTLLNKEEEILTQLEGSPLFIQLESLRKTIQAFKGNGQNTPSNGVHEKNASSVAAIYDPDQMTWKERVRFVVNKIGTGGVAEVINEIQRLEPDKHTKSFLDKRVGVTLSQMKHELGTKIEDKKRKYFIK